MYSDNLEEALAADGYVHQFTYGEGGYSWEEWRVYTKDRRVFVLEDSGCSCNDFGEFWDDVHEVIGAMYEVTETPSLDTLAEQSQYSSWDDPLEVVQQKYRELFSGIATGN